MKYMHLRFGQVSDGKANYYPRGGMTFAWEVKDDGLSVGVSICSLNDNFCRRIGRSVADGRVNWHWKNEDFKKIPTNKDIAEQLAEQFVNLDGFIDYEYYLDFLRSNPRTLYLDV